MAIPYLPALSLGALSLGALSLLGCGVDVSHGLTGQPSMASSTGGGIGGAGGSGDTGGAGGHAVGGAGGMGAGGAGGFDPCATLTWVSPVADVQPSVDPSFQVKPQLVPTSDNGHQITVVVQETPTISPGSTAEVKHATFSPWLAWPASSIVGPTFSVSGPSQDALSFAATAAPSGRFGVLVGDGTAARCAPRVDPLADGAEPVLTVPGGLPLFAATSGEIQIVGARTASGVLRATLLRDQEGSFSTQTVTLSCSPAGVVAGAVPYGDGFLVVSSNGASTIDGACPAQPSAAGPPTRIDVYRVGWDAPPAFVMGIDAGADVTQLVAASHPDGVWAVWLTATPSLPAPLRYARFEPDAVAGPGMFGPGEVGKIHNDAQVTFSAAPLARRLAVAYRGEPAATNPELHVRLIGEQGALVAHTVLPAHGDYAEPTSLVASPTGDSLLVAFDGWLAHLARLDCAPAGP